MRALLTSALVLAALGCDTDPCDAASLEGALATAVAGDVVTIGACEIEGAFEVPAGVTLRGVDAERSAIRGPAGSRALTLGPGAAGQPTAVESLGVVVDGCVGVLARGTGAVRLTDVRIDAHRGIGIGAEGLDALTLERVSIEGLLADGVAPPELPLAPYTCESADPATHGLVAVSVSSAALCNVDVRGFAAFGVLFVDTTSTWDGGMVENNFSTGVEAYGGDATFTNMSLCRARQGTFAVEAFNGLFANGAVVTTRGVTVCEGEQFGLMHDAATGTHTDLDASDNAFAAVWSQRALALTLDGAATRIERNGFAGIATFDTIAVDVSDGTIAGTTERVYPMGGGGAIRAADGILLAGATASTVRGVSLTNNARVGVLVDLSGGTSMLDVAAVVIEAEGTALGAIAQNGTAPAGWDSDVDRRGATLANDAVFRGALPIAGAVGPSCLPDPAGLAATGLASLVGGP